MVAASVSSSRPGAVRERAVIGTGLHQGDRGTGRDEPGGDHGARGPATRDDHVRPAHARRP